MCDFPQKYPGGMADIPQFYKFYNTTTLLCGVCSEIEGKI